MPGNRLLIVVLAISAVLTLGYLSSMLVFSARPVFVVAMAGLVSRTEVPVELPAPVAAEHWRNCDPYLAPNARCQLIYYEAEDRHTTSQPATSRWACDLTGCGSTLNSRL